MQNKVVIKEIFESIQGEGPYIGVNQLFIRFSKCNLACNYCDTDFSSNLKEYSLDELINEVNNHKNIHSISLTGGEPLTESKFLNEFLKKVNKKIYLETNGTLYKNLEEIIDYVDIISMDIKLPSSSGLDYFESHKKFIDISVKNKKEIFLKVVFNEKITEEEIISTINLAKENNLLIILQPQTENNKIITSSEMLYNIFSKYINLYKNIRLIPQVHKFMELR